MADAAIIDVDVEVSMKEQKANGHGRSRNIRKPKRVTLSLQNLSAQDIEAFDKNLTDFLMYYKEVKDQKVVVELNECGPRNAVIAVLTEESEREIEQTAPRKFLPVSRFARRFRGRWLTISLGKI